MPQAAGKVPVSCKTFDVSAMIARLERFGKALLLPQLAGRLPVRCRLVKDSWDRTGKAPAAAQAAGRVPAEVLSIRSGWENASKCLKAVTSRCLAALQVLY